MNLEEMATIRLSELENERFTSNSWTDKQELHYQKLKNWVEDGCPTI